MESKLIDPKFEHQRNGFRVSHEQNGYLKSGRRYPVHSLTKADSLRNTNHWNHCLGLEPLISKHNLRVKPAFWLQFNLPDTVKFPPLLELLFNPGDNLESHNKVNYHSNNALCQLKIKNNLFIISENLAIYKICHISFKPLILTHNLR